MKDGNGGLLFLGAVLFVGYLFGRRRSRPPAYAPPTVWGAPVAKSGPSVKTAMVVIVAVSALLAGFAQTLPAAGKSRSGGLKLGSIFGALPNLPEITAPGGAARPSSKAKRAVRFVLAQRGDRYRLGADGPNAWDCSGLTQAAWRAAGIKIPATAEAQRSALPKVKGKLRAGDLVVYHSSASPSGRHVAMVVAPGQVVEARGRRYGVVQARLRGGWLKAVRPGGR